MYICGSVVNGTPLPNGHGKIVDESKITEVYFTQTDGETFNVMKMPDQVQIIGTNAPAIIEEESEDKR